jgi:putative phosphoesterase
MRTAIIGDVHANLPALEAVLTHARAAHVDHIWNVGDSVGYGAFPEEVVQRIQHEGVTSILGNYDLKVLQFPDNQKKFHKTKRPEKYLAFKFAYEHLSEASRTYLKSLPEEIWLGIQGRQILLVHGSPASNEELLTEDTPKRRLKELAKLAEKKSGKHLNLLIVGHSHQPFVRRVGEVWFINPGSVGRPDDGDPRASYAVLELSQAGVQVELFRVEYDVQRAARAVRERGLPEAFAQMLLRGVDLQKVIEDRA